MQSWRKTNGHSEAESELKTLLNAKIHSVKVTPRTLEGNLITWSAWQKYKPNLPVVGYLEIEFSEDRRAAGRQPSDETETLGSNRRAHVLPLAEVQRKTLSLELGQVGDELRLVNYITDGEREPPTSLDPGPSITSHMEPLSDGKYLVTDIITNPGTLLSAHLANEEVRQRDFNRQRHEAADDAGDLKVDAAPDGDGTGL